MVKERITNFDDKLPDMDKLDEKCLSVIIDYSYSSLKEIGMLVTFLNQVERDNDIHIRSLLKIFKDKVVSIDVLKAFINDQITINEIRRLETGMSEKECKSIDADLIRIGISTFLKILDKGTGKD